MMLRPSRYARARLEASGEAMRKRLHARYFRRCPKKPSRAERGGPLACLERLEAGHET